MNGKGDKWRTSNKDYSCASIWCKCGRFKDKCEQCNVKPTAKSKKQKK